jgi:hypothetical protein
VPAGGNRDAPFGQLSPYISSLHEANTCLLLDLRYYNKLSMFSVGRWDTQAEHEGYFNTVATALP